MDLEKVIRRARRFSKLYRIRDGSGFRLKDFDPADTGPITKKIQDVYHEAIRGKVKKYEAWCDLVG